MGAPLGACPGIPINVPDQKWHVLLTITSSHAGRK